MYIFVYTYAYTHTHTYIMTIAVRLPPPKIFKVGASEMTTFSPGKIKKETANTFMHDKNFD